MCVVGCGHTKGRHWNVNGKAASESRSIARYLSPGELIAVVHPFRTETEQFTFFFVFFSFVLFSSFFVLCFFPNCLLFLFGACGGVVFVCEFYKARISIWPPITTVLGYIVGRRIYSLPGLCLRLFCFCLALLDDSHEIDRSHCTLVYFILVIIHHDINFLLCSTLEETDEKNARTTISPSGTHTHT